MSAPACLTRAAHACCLMVQVLLSDLTTQEGRAILHVHDSNAHNYSSWYEI